jgi:hypothetical protein
MKVAIFLAALALPGVATAAESAILLKPAAAPTIDLARPVAAFAPTYAEAPPPRIRGVARTSIDRQLDGDDVLGSLGFMCGLKPGAEKSGAAAAHGYDPTGRFVGARLKFTFR